MARGQDTGSHPGRKVDRPSYSLLGSYNLPGYRGSAEYRMEEELNNEALMNEYHVDETVGRRSGVGFEDPYTGKTV